MSNPHYNYPLTRDRRRLVHYYRVLSGPRFCVRRLSYGIQTRGFGWNLTWVLWPRD